LCLLPKPFKRWHGGAVFGSGPCSPFTLMPSIHPSPPQQSSRAPSRGTRRGTGRRRGQARSMRRPRPEPDRDRVVFGDGRHGRGQWTIAHRWEELSCSSQDYNPRSMDCSACCWPLFKGLACGTIPMQLGSHSQIYMRIRLRWGFRPTSVEPLSLSAMAM
jgi:hypothetical protein